jgi:uroporphyrinogen decarboxylase
MQGEGRGLWGLRVAAFESRRAGEMARMIERFGGEPWVSPSLREVPVDAHREAVDFAHRLMTGVGVRHLLAAIERHVDRQRFLSALTDVVTVARGPKPVAALKELGLTPTHRVGEPNTWREVLALCDARLPVAQQAVGLIEYGLPNASLVAGLEARGARVESVRVYRYDLPQDQGPLQENVRRLARGEADVALFTSSHQAVNLLRVAESLDLAAQVRQGLARAVVGSIGPATSDTLRELELPVDFEPSHGKLGQLVQAAAEDAPGLVRRKRLVESLAVVSPHSGPVPRPGPWDQSLLMRAARREPTEVTPIWLMRQAGRYMEEYRAVRERMSFLELCKNPQLCAEVMLTAVQRLGVDAAIIFSDLLPLLEPMGMRLEFTAGEGPLLHEPLRTAADVDRLVELESLAPLEFVMETVRQTRAGLPDSIPVIGFAGAPFTLASYAIEGGASRSFLHTKRLMYQDEGAWQALLGRLVRAVTHYLNGQLAAGAQTVQLFDSWVGCLSPADYRRYVLPFNQAVLAGLPAGVPAIHFATGNPALLPLMAEAGGAVVGVDWRVELDVAWQQVGTTRSVQGNLDPAVLLADRVEIRRQARRILDQARGRAGHIFNLGHGIHPQTPVDNVIALVDAVHELSAARGRSGLEPGSSSG